MYVTRGTSAVLTANNEGVEALNLKTNQFLIIGDYTRFEPYVTPQGDRRTACFFLG